MPKFKPLPPIERLNELLEVVEIPPEKYGVWSGLVRKVSRGGTARAGTVAGFLQRSDVNPKRFNWTIKVDGVNYVASRVIYYMAYGKNPGDVEVDHEDQNWLNNNAWNLRLDISGDIQKVNRGMQSNNASGVMNVSWDNKVRKWRAVVNRKHLGYFTCKIEAVHAVNEKWRELGWLELGRKLNDLSAIQCDCDKCKSHLDKVAE